MFGFGLFADGETQAGDEIFDLTFGDLVGVEADCCYALRVGGGAGRNSLLLAEHGVEARGAGDTTEAMDLIRDDSFWRGGYCLERSQGAGCGDGHYFEKFSAKHNLFLLRLNKNSFRS